MEQEGDYDQVVMPTGWIQILSHHRRLNKEDSTHRVQSLAQTIILLAMDFHGDIYASIDIRHNKTDTGLCTLFGFIRFMGLRDLETK